MHDKAPGAHRSEPGEGVGDPVALLRQTEGRGARGLRVRRGGDERANRVLVRREAEIGLDQPRPAAFRPRLVGLESGRGGLGGLEALDDEVRDRARPALVADEPHDVRGVVGRKAFEHGRRLK